MIKEIRKAENGFRITTDKGEIYLDYCRMNEIIGHNGDLVFGHGDGNLVSLNVVTDEYDLWTPYKDEYRLFQIELCNNLCYFQCESEDEEQIYETVFDYLKKCPDCNYIDDLTAHLISEYIRRRGIDDAGYGLSELFPPTYCSLEDDSDLHRKYNPNFEFVLKIAKMIVESDEKI